LPKSSSDSSLLKRNHGKEKKEGARDRYTNGPVKSNSESASNVISTGSVGDDSSDSIGGGGRSSSVGNIGTFCITSDGEEESREGSSGNDKRSKEEEEEEKEEEGEQEQEEPALHKHRYREREQETKETEEQNKTEQNTKEQYRQGKHQVILYICLITRKSNKHPGTRYFARGFNNIAGA